MQKEEDDINPDLDGDLNALNYMQTPTSTANADVGNEVDEHSNEDGFVTSDTSRAPVSFRGKGAGRRGTRCRGGKNVRSRSPHRVCGFLWEQQINDRTYRQFTERAGPQKGTQIMYPYWKFKNFMTTRGKA